MTVMAFYPYLLAAHVTAVVFFVGTLFAQNRILSAIKHFPREQQTGHIATLLRLDRHVTVPALLFTWIFGVSVALMGGWLPSRWLMMKLVFVVGLSALHGVQSGMLRRFIRNELQGKSIPWSGPGLAVMMVVIVVLAIAKPI